MAVRMSMGSSYHEMMPEVVVAVVVAERDFGIEAVVADADMAEVQFVGLAFGPVSHAA